jgi:hypothetical protein
MIDNKGSYRPENSQFWNILEKTYPQEAAYIFKEFLNICQSKIDTIYGREEIKKMFNKLNKIYPDFIESFKKIFPDLNFAIVLGLGLWYAIDADDERWFYSDIFSQENIFQTRVYAKKKFEVECANR